MTPARGYDPAGRAAFAPTRWTLAHGRSLVLGPRALVMGVVNVTPDSFSDGGRHADADSAVAHGRSLVEEGADILDIGGESSRPGAAEIGAQEELDRILPVIERLAGLGVPLSIDSWRAGTALAAIAAGAHIVNDIWGLQRDDEMAVAVATTGAGCVVMHTGRGRERLPDPVDDQIAFLSDSLALARRAGVEDTALVVDPGLGFAKDADANFALLARLGELAPLGRPILVGASRKRFLGSATGRDVTARDPASAAAAVVARLAGASIIRAHAVAPTRDALRIADAVLAARGLVEGDGA